MSRNDFVPFRLTICGVEELPLHATVGVSHVVSILDPDHGQVPVFERYHPHARVDLRFDDVIEELPERAPPGVAHVAQVLDFGRQVAATAGPDDHLLVHCYMGISRSTAAMSLILAQARPDRPVAEALETVVRIRPQAWPNLRMLEIGGDMLGRRAELLDAVRDIYARAAADKPEWLRFLAENDRAREIAHFR